MGYTLITGTSGRIGRALAVRLIEARRPIVGLGRHSAGVPSLPEVQGDFTHPDNLRALDGVEIEAAVHLAAVTGGCSEADGLAVNVGGTATLIRYLVDRGCRRVVLASSIAAVGLADAEFIPLRVPIPDDHPCLARDAYGLSKHLMEETSRYFARRHPDVCLVALRLASIASDASLPPPRAVGALGPYALASVTVMALSDAARVLDLALTAPLPPGAHTYNAAAPRAWTRAPTSDILRSWYGGALDLGHYEAPGREFDSVFAVARARADLGFEAERVPNPGPR